MGKTIAAVVLWSLAVAGGIAYYVQNRPVSSAPVAPAVTTAVAPSPSVPVLTEATEPPPPPPLKRSMEAFGLAQTGTTITLIVTPPAPGTAYSVTMTQQAGGIYAGINPSTAPSIYHDFAASLNPLDPVRNRLPVIIAFPFQPNLWRVVFTTSLNSTADYGGGMLREVSPSPLSATPFTAPNGPSVTRGWSLRLTN